MLKPLIIPFALSLAGLLSISPAFSRVLISEVVASNDDSLDDEDSDSPDWIELFNSGSDAVDLDGWHLTDDFSNIRKWTFPSRTLEPGAFLVVFASGKDRKPDTGNLHTNFSLSRSGEYLSLNQPNGDVEFEYAPEMPQQATDISYGIAQSTVETVLVAQNAPARAGVPSSEADFLTAYDGWNTQITGNFDGSTWRNVRTGVGYDNASTYGQWLGLDGSFASEMYNGNTSIFLRVPFSISDAGVVSSLKLRMRYDDGFIAYINGVKVAEGGAPASPEWNSIAERDRPDGQNEEWEEFTIDLSQVTLNSGNNLLAIHGCNIRTGSSDMLILPELVAVSAAGSDLTPVYLDRPTPGEVNTSGRASLPPLIDGVTEGVDQLPVGGAGSAPIVVTAQVTETAYAVSNVQVLYRYGFGAEQIQNMRDDGGGNDLVANDGIYTGAIQTTSMSPGSMVRWKVRALDNLGQISTSPPYLDPLDADEYFGTIAEDPSLATSNLPVLHWFIESPTAANSRSGTRASFFYEGEFYDNIQVDLHGQTTSGFPKKSYDVDFNQNNRFTWKLGEIKAKDINLLTNWADKTKVRNTLAYEFFRDSGGPYHYAFPIRVQQNGQFFSITDLVEDGDDRFLERIGLDPEGTLYKMYNRLSSTSGASKKTQKETGKNDLQVIIDSLDESLSQDQRRLYGYDNVDIPGTVNYLAGLALAGSQDQGHKNYYIYRDTFGTGEWTPLPWDVDLSFGHDWGGQGYFDDDLLVDQPLQLGPSNRLKTFIWGSPELNQMFVRRVRSLMDELLEPSSTPIGQRKVENRLNELRDLMDPPGVVSDADLDFAKWGSWEDGNRSSTDASNEMSAQIDRLINDYLPRRRAFLYGSVPESNGVPVPDEQAQSPSLLIEMGEFVAASGNPDEEFIRLRNLSSDAIDISGWILTGGIEHRFKAGTVIPSGEGDSRNDFVGILHVVKDSTAFRNRANGPSGGEYRFIQGGYQGQLSSRGETIELRNRDGVLMTSLTYSGSPSLAQDALRVSEINYHPADPRPGELASIPSLSASDFEFIELMNVSNQTLDLGGCYFADGIGYVFGSGVSLQSGERLILAKNIAAFELRYGTGQLVLGPFEGSLANEGERLQLLDSLGEEILDFEWNDKWYPPSDGEGRTLVLRNPMTTAFNDFDQASSWGLSAEADGSPSIQGRYERHFSGWTYQFFNKTQREDLSVGAAGADPDLDGRTNWQEYCFGTDPMVKDSVEHLALTVEVDDEVFPAIRFKRQPDAYDLVWSLKHSSSLQDDWQDADHEIHGQPTIEGPEQELVTFRTSESLDQWANPSFLRAVAEPRVVGP